jgi:hypothetical protein
MDTSETYIKMCDCPEIQDLRPVGEEYIDGDWYKMGDHYTRDLKPGFEILEVTKDPDWFENDKYFESARTITFEPMVVERTTGYDNSSWLPERDEGDIWLPRQDQLQEMLDSDLPFILVDFYYFARDDVPAISVEFTTMEQLWLAFVMKEKYNKVWSGTEWVTS